MKKLALYHLPIAYMLFYAIAILLSGLWLFLLSQGLASHDILPLFNKILNNPQPKSLHTFIEITTPHIFAIGILLFTLTHFLLFSNKISHTFSRKISILFFCIALFNILAYLPITLGLVFLGWIKLLSLGLFILLFLLLLGILGFSLSFRS
jgi:hypothetical protein